MAGAVSGKNQGQQVYICPGNGQTNQWCQRRGFAPAKDSKALLGTESQSLIFCENSRLTAGYGVARAVREDEQVSGDNFSFLDVG